MKNLVTKDFNLKLIKLKDDSTYMEIADPTINELIP
jgi:hypothetical protein